MHAVPTTTLGKRMRGPFQHPRQWIESSQGGPVYLLDAPAVPRLSIRPLYWHNPRDRAKLIVVGSITIPLIVCLPPILTSPMNAR